MTINSKLGAILVAALAAVACGDDGGDPVDENSVPVASAGDAETVLIDAAYQLDGSGSSDPDGDALGYTWSLAGPDGTAAVLSDPTASTPTFTPDLIGDYTLTLIVEDGELSSDPASVVITARDNAVPTADAGAPIAADTGELVALDASASLDDDDDELSYSWSLEDPDGVDASSLLSDATAMEPEFTPDAEGDYIATLIVNDGWVDSDEATVTITVTAP